MIETILPLQDALPVTPNDGADIPVGCRGLILGTGGNLKVNTAYGQTRALLGIPAGRLDLPVTRVFATGTTATNITALY